MIPAKYKNLHLGPSFFNVTSIKKPAKNRLVYQFTNGSTNVHVLKKSGPIHTLSRTYLRSTKTPFAGN